MILRPEWKETVVG